MFQKHLKYIAIICGIGILILFSLWNIGAQPPALSKPRAKFTRQKGTTRHPRHTHVQESLTPFQKSDFYRTIVDNNIFRPLGWTPQRPREGYRLLGTILPTGGKGGVPKAILEDTLRKQNRTLMIGDKLDADTTLIDIQPKQVTLEKSGQQRTVHLNTTPFLK